MTKKEQVFKVLFDDDDTIGICKSKYSTGKKMGRTKNSDCSDIDGQFFVLNPLKSDSNTRKKSDIAVYRNILIEFDDALPLDEQIEYVKSINMPYSSIVYSGNKSYHFVISLETPLVNADEYEYYANFVHNVVKKADPQTKEPNKLSRLPEGTRVGKNIAQEVIEIQSRVKNGHLLSWLEKYQELAPIKTDKKHSEGSSKDRESIVEVLNWYVQEYLKQDYDFDKKWTFVRCPVCAEESRDNHRDNMCITHENMFFNCFADKEHNKSQFFSMLELKNEHGESNTYKAWKEHNQVSDMVEELDSES